MVSFRIPSQTLIRLREEAAEEKISLNTLVNQVLEHHTEWGVYTGKLGMLSLGRGTYKALLESSDERLLQEKGRLVGPKLRDTLLFMYKRADLDVLIELIMKRKRDFGIGEIEVSREGSHVLMLLNHDFGRKHSIFIASLAEAAIHSLIGSKPKLQITDNSVVVEFTASPASLYRPPRIISANG